MPGKNERVKTESKLRESERNPDSAREFIIFMPFLRSHHHAIDHPPHPPHSRVLPPKPPALCFHDYRTPQPLPPPHIVSTMEADHRVLYYVVKVAYTMTYFINRVYYSGQKKKKIDSYIRIFIFVCSSIYFHFSVN